MRVVPVVETFINSNLRPRLSLLSQFCSKLSCLLLFLLSLLVLFISIQMSSA